MYRTLGISQKLASAANFSAVVAIVEVPILPFIWGIHVIELTTVIYALRRMAYHVVAVVCVFIDVFVIITGANSICRGRFLGPSQRGVGI